MNGSLKYQVADEPQLKSRHLVLRKLNPSDVTDAYMRWLNDYETTKYLEVRFKPQTKKDIQGFVRKKGSKDSDTLHLGVFDKAGSLLMGTVTFNHMDFHHLSASISFVIGYPGATGKGYATEAVHAATYYMFFKRNFEKLWGGYYEGHYASEKVFLKNGYQIEGRLKKKLINYQHERVDHIYVGILRSDFRPQEKYLGPIE